MNWLRCKPILYNEIPGGWICSASEIECSISHDRVRYTLKHAFNKLPGMSDFALL